jgi:hypothetical protein
VEIRDSTRRETGTLNSWWFDVHVTRGSPVSLLQAGEAWKSARVRSLRLAMKLVFTPRPEHYNCHGVQKKLHRGDEFRILKIL